MKTIQEIKLEARRKADLKQLHEFNELVKWLEDAVIPKYLEKGHTGCSIFGWDRNIEKHYDKLKPVLESAG